MKEASGASVVEELIPLSPGRTGEKIEKRRYCAPGRLEGVSKNLGEDQEVVMESSPS